MVPRSKDRVALIIAKMKKGPEKNSSESEWKKPHRESDEYSESDVGSESSDSVGLESAADDILQAIRDRDASALVSALSDFLHIHADECSDCSSDGDSSEEDA